MILGTAGHVDHGKTALVKALTGTDTDRLPEEKRRGITLELGFAHLKLPDGRALGVVDVPGHERFVKAMAAGAGGIDLVLLVVAADEGVMPQTREHVDICSLLGVRAGVIVVTKSDLLPGLGEGWLELLEADLRALVAGTFLEGAKLVTVSAKTGAGLPELVAEVARTLDALERRPADGPLFLPIDRAFTLKGFGCVVTGTLLSGRLALADELSLLPGLPGPWRLRGLQVHGVAVEQVAAGERVALNLVALETAQVHRGMAVVRSGELTAAKSLDVELSLLPAVEKPLPRRSRQLVSLGTAQVEAVVQLLDVAALRPGETAFAQLRLASPVAALAGQRFIIRGSSAVPGRGATVGGGRVLALHAPRRRTGAGAKLARLATADLETRVAWLLTEAGYAGLTERELYARASAAPKELARALELGAARGQVVLVDKEQRRFLGADVFQALQARALAALEAFHAGAPEQEGLPREELRQKLGVPHERTFQRLLAALVEQRKVDTAAPGDALDSAGPRSGAAERASASATPVAPARLSGDLLRLPGRGHAFTAAASTLKDAVAAALAKAGLAPPTLAELASKVQAPEERVATLLKALVTEGRAVKAGELCFDLAAVKALEARLVALLAEKGSISTQEFKDLTGQSRKFVIPLAEYFDRERVTLRVGDKRVPRKRA